MATPLKNRQPYICMSIYLSSLMYTCFYTQLQFTLLASLSSSFNMQMFENPHNGETEESKGNSTFGPNFCDCSQYIGQQGQLGLCRTIINYFHHRDVHKGGDWNWRWAQSNGNQGLESQKPIRLGSTEDLRSGRYAQLTYVFIAHDSCNNKAKWQPRLLSVQDDFPFQRTVAL